MLARVVADTCSKVITGSAQELDAFKASFGVSSGVSEKSGDTVSGSGQALGTAAPTKTVADLVTLAVIRAHPATVVDKVVEREEYQQVRKDLTDMLAPIKDLVQAVKNQVNRIKTRKDAHHDLHGKKFGDLTAPKVLCVC